MDTCGTVAWFAGIKDTDTLETASKLCDETSYLQRGQEHETQHPVLTPGMIYQLPPKYALIMRGGLSPVIAHAPIGWHDLGYLLARIRGQAVAPVRALAQLERAAPRQAVPPMDRWAGVDSAPAAPEPADATAGHVPQGRLPWDVPANGHGANGSGARVNGGHDGH
jgi:hypothetical protein